MIYCSSGNKSHGQFPLSEPYIRGLVKIGSVHIILIGSLLVIGTHTNAQKAKDYLKLGDASWAESDWAMAHHYYGEAFKIDSLNFDFGVKYAEATRMVRDYEEAARLYAKLYQKDKGKLFSEGLFWLATMQKHLGDYKEAMRNFKKAQKQHIKNKEGYPYRKCEKEIAACTFALNSRFDTSAVRVHRPDDLNTSESELSPWFTTGGQLFFASYPFSSDKPKGSERIQLYQSLQTDSLAYSIPEVLSGLPADAHLANLSIHPDGTRVYFSKCPPGGNCEIWTGLLGATAISDAQPVKGIDSEANNTMPHFAVIDGKGVLFFASDRPGGQGKFDLWWAMAKSETEFEPAANCGPEINSTDQELSPFYASDALYFSSDWHEGYGGLDLFKSPGKPRHFSMPENLGPPFNSSLNDLYYTYDKTRQTGWFASNRISEKSQSGTACCNDLYRFWYTDSLLKDEPENPYASLENLNKYLPVTLYFHNDEPNPRTRDTVSTFTYGQSYEAYLKLRSTYEKEMTRNLSSEEREEAIFEVDEFFDLTVQKGMSDLQKFSALLLIELEKGTDITLMVKGFASPRAKSDYNLKLTQRRISSLEKQLKAWQNGALLSYFNKTAASGGTLQITAVPFGEYRADQAVSDEQGDEKSSIYSRGARLERKIEIQSVQRNREEDGPCLESPAFAVDLGKINKNDTVTFSFTLKNCGRDTLVLAEVLSPCECTLARSGFERLAPGRAGVVDIQFTPARINGVFSRQVMIRFEGYEEPRELVIMGEAYSE